MTTFDKVLECLEEVGVFFDVKDCCDDIDLREYDIDSISFISFIINLENEFGITIPDYMVNYESFCSIVAVARYIDETIASAQQT